jgi:hypothetical protein
VRASLCLVFGSLVVTGCFRASGYDGRELASDSKVAATGHGREMASRRAGVARLTEDELENRGGAVIGDATIYAIWWGDRARFPSDAMTGIDGFLSGLQGSSYVAIADQYLRRQVRTSFAGHLLETSPSPNHAPTTDEIVDKVCKVLADARQAPSPTALYLVFTDGFPEAGGFCAWHDGGLCPGGRRIHVAYMPNMANAPQCDPGDLFRCNGLSAATRSLANVTAHEVMEMLTDPDGDGWLDRSGEEIADRCNFRFGSCVTLGSTKWQLQKQWSNADSACIQEKTGASSRVAAAN